LIELMFVLGVAATLAAVSLPQLAASVHEFRAAGAARYVAARLQQARVRAITRDGNRNGVLAADIAAGIDTPVGAQEHLADQFPDVDFGAISGIPGAEGSTAPGSDPIRLGSADSVTFTPTGTATSGSLYVRGKPDIQYVLRIYGETGRTRILRYNARTRTWFSR